LQFQRWLTRKAWRISTDQAQRMAQLQPLPEFAAQALRKGQRKVRRRAQDFGQLSPGARHALRILVKRQRYAAEFFKFLHAGGKGKSYLQALIIAQDGLGRANATHVASMLLNTLPEARDKQVAAFVEGWLAHAAMQPLDHTFERALAKLL
jgi:CHAD domain-containing protein